MFGNLFSDHASAKELNRLRIRLNLVEAMVRSEEEFTEVAAKSNGRPRRDRHGRRVEKPFGASQREDPRRDSQGYRTNKPFQPKGR